VPQKARSWLLPGGAGGAWWDLHIKSALQRCLDCRLGSLGCVPFRNRNSGVPCQNCPPDFTLTHAACRTAVRGNLLQVRQGEQGWADAAGGAGERRPCGVELPTLRCCCCCCCCRLPAQPGWYTRMRAMSSTMVDSRLASALPLHAVTANQDMIQGERKLGSYMLSFVSAAAHALHQTPQLSRSAQHFLAWESAHCSRVRRLARDQL